MQVSESEPDIQRIISTMDRIMKQDLSPELINRRKNNGLQK